MKGGERKKRGENVVPLLKFGTDLYVMQDIRLPSLTSGEREREKGSERELAKRSPCDAPEGVIERSQQYLVAETNRMFRQVHR